METTEHSIPSESLSIFEITKIIDEQLTGTIKLKDITVVGEITRWNSQYSSGHIYFTLKDKEDPLSFHRTGKKAILDCTFWSFKNKSLTFEPKPGDEVRVTGSVSVYYEGGKYSFNVSRMEKVGLGNLFLKVQELRNKLMKKGIIDPSLRKKIPSLPHRVGIVTSPGGAALEDIRKQIKDRYPNVNILISPAIVQGDSAADSIASAIKEVSKPEHECDLIILTRGGGSPEDLMPFNDEKVAMAVFQCRLPVISGVGHQIDHPICDDVADLAAATPTDAAKEAFPIISDFSISLERVQKRLDQCIELMLKIASEKLNRLSDKPFFREPQLLLMEHYHRLDHIEIQLNEFYRHVLNQSNERLRNIYDLNFLFERRLNQDKSLFSNLNGKLEAFSPLATLKRGYSVTYQNGKILKKMEDVQMNKKIEVQISDGKFKAMPS